VEDKIPTYRVDRNGRQRSRNTAWGDEDDDEHGLDEFMEEQDIFGDDGTISSTVTANMLRSIVVADSTDNAQRRPSLDEASTASGQSSDGVHSLSISYLVELDKNPWRYRNMFNVGIAGQGEEDSKKTTSDDSKVCVEARPMVKLRDAIGERRYRAWKLSQEQKQFSSEESTRMTNADLQSTDAHNALDLTSLLSSVTDDTSMTSDLSSMSSISSAGRNANRNMTPEQQRAADARDRDVLRKCLERAYEGAQGGTQRRARPRRRTSIGATTQNSESFQENGRDLIGEAETALRNPSAQRFLVSVLSQRSRLENQRKKRNDDHSRGMARHRQNNQSSVSRLQPAAFECLVRLCCAMLEACMEAQDYEPAYRLLTHTAGFCTVVQSKPNEKSEDEKSEENTTGTNTNNDQQENTKIVYMTAKIGMHPIFAELNLWEKVLALHLQDRQNDRQISGGSIGSGSDRSQGKEGSTDTAEYDAAVATLYEMLGYGIPAEELARFATRVSEDRGWFTNEKGQRLLVLARRLSVSRDERDTDGAGDLGIVGGGLKPGGAGQGPDDRKNDGVGGRGLLDDGDDAAMEWEEICWAHPASGPTGGAPNRSTSQEGLGTAKRGVREGYSLLNHAPDSASDDTFSQTPEASSKTYNGKIAITSLASFGSTVVATGGLDGSVFLAHTIQFRGDANSQRLTGFIEVEESEPLVRGVRLDWGAVAARPATVGTSTRPEGDLGVGAVSCLAAARGAGYRLGASGPGAGRKGETSRMHRNDQAELLAAMEGCRVVAGTTGGDLRVWSVKDVYAATVLTSGPSSSEMDPASDMVSASLAEVRLRGAHGSEMTSGYRAAHRSSIHDVAVGSATSRLKSSLRGRALLGHRGGVTCIDVPSHIYRPDALVTGGADGLIKLWTLRQTMGRRGGSEATTVGLPSTGAPSSSVSFSTNTRNLQNSYGSGIDMTQRRRGSVRGSDPVTVMTGHGGRVLCVNTAWHGDRLLSGGADRTVRIWDLAGSGGKCLHVMSGHLGWVTQAHYWGPNTVVSASTDRSICLWDARIKTSPLFVLRHHLSPISDLLVGTRTDPLMMSAGGDGTVATWDFRTLSGSTGNSERGGGAKPIGSKPCKTVRSPLSTMNHCKEGKHVKYSGGVLLSRGVDPNKKSVLSVSVDGKMKEWDIASGRVLGEMPVGHTDVVSQFTSCLESDDLRRYADGRTGDVKIGGTITSSWDGTVRMRRLIQKG